MSLTCENQFAYINGRHLAYRSFSEGKLVVLCGRFQGNMDSWAPAFLDALVAQGFRVITFDHSGLGLSKGDATYNPIEMVCDPVDLMPALDLQKTVLVVQ